MAITATKPRTNARANATNNFLWADMQAKDLQAAIDFYGRVLGWEFRQETDPAGNVVYNTAHIGGVRVAGVAQMMEQQLASGMPSMWTDYVYVADCAKTCEQVTALGGSVLMQPMDVMGEGWMAIAADPTGAAFGVWQPGRHTGADAFNQPGTLVWTELYTDDVEASKAFYSELLGWSFDRMEMPGDDTEYWLVMQDGRSIAGIMPKSDDMRDVPNHWATYFGCADIDALVAEAKSAGGNVVWGPMQAGPGRAAGIQDAAGAMVHFIQMDEWPQD